MGQVVRQRKGVLWLPKDVDIAVVIDGKCSPEASSGYNATYSAPRIWNADRIVR